MALAKELLDKYGEKIVLPVDVVIADKFENDAHKKTVHCNEIPHGWRGLDIGKQTIQMYEQMLKLAKTIIWNGPMGVFEFENFAEGTFAIAKCLSNLNATTIAGGGDSVAAINQLEVADKFTHISTAGGACLELLAGKKLPALEALERNN